jgi:hemolysin III
VTDLIVEVPVTIEVRPSWRGRLHRSAFFVALGLAPGLVAAATTPAARLAVAVYAACLMGLFGVSALFHCVPWGDMAHARMRRLDHSMIFVFIAGSYTPIAVLALDGGLRTLVLASALLASAAGILVQLLWIDAPRGLTAGLYVVVGWMIVLAVPAIVERAGLAAVALLALGGLTYTAGALVYARKRPDPFPEVFGFHEVFHLLTILAAGMHLAVIAFWLLPLAA